MQRSSSPSFSQELSLQRFTPKQFLVIAVSIAQELGWNIEHISNRGFIAFSNAGLSERSKITLKLENFTAKLTSEPVEQSINNTPAIQKAVVDFTLLLHNSRYVYSVKELEERFEALKPFLVPPEADILRQQSAAAFKESKAEFFSIFIPRKGYFITPVLLFINVGVFGMMVLFVQSFQFDIPTLLSWGANSRFVTLLGQPWRLLTCCFLHWNALHLFMNMVALLLVGHYLEPYITKTKFAAAYLLTGILSSVVSLYWHDGVSAGASGAIFGLYGVFLALLTTNIIEPEQRGNLLISMIVFVGYNLIGSRNDTVDHAAHLGGLISGIIIGYCFYFSLKIQKV